MRIDFGKRYPYKRWESATHPLVLVTLRHGDRETSFYGLIDSGADQCLFHSSYAVDLGIDPYTGTPSRIEGITDAAPMMGFTHILDMIVADFELKGVPVDFADGPMMRDGWTDQLVGRDVVFDRLRIGFRQGRQAMYLGAESRVLRV